MNNVYGCNSAKLMLVIEVKATRGSGTAENDAVREATEYWSIDGKKLAEHDPIALELDMSDEDMAAILARAKIKRKSER